MRARMGSSDIKGVWPNHVVVCSLLLVKRTITTADRFQQKLEL